MATRTITRGDSYSLRRPLYQITFINAEGDPMDLAGCTIRTTYKAEQTTIEEDPEDIHAVIVHELVIDEAGLPVVEDGLYLIGDAVEGTIEERLTAAETKTLPLNTPLLGDIEIQDAAGEIFTWIVDEELVAVDGYTHRSLLDL